MELHLIKFSGRKIGALGVTDTYEEYMLLDPNKMTQLLDTLYKKYEHIRIIRCVSLHEQLRELKRKLTTDPFNHRRTVMAIDQLTSTINSKMAELAK